MVFSFCLCLTVCGPLFSAPTQLRSTRRCSEPCSRGWDPSTSAPEWPEEDKKQVFVFTSFPLGWAFKPPHPELHSARRTPQTKTNCCSIMNEPSWSDLNRCVTSKATVSSAWPMRCSDTTDGRTPFPSRTSVRLVCTIRNWWTKQEMSYQNVLTVFRLCGPHQREVLRRRQRLH